MFIEPSVKVQAMVILTANTDVTSGGGSATLVTNPYNNAKTETALIRADSLPWETSHSLIFGSRMVGVTPNTNLVGNFTKSQNVILGNTFSSVPVIWRQELESQYQELGRALSDLTELQEDDEWQVDRPVYQVACHIAAELVAVSFPPPSVFTHGSMSVVFNWEAEDTSLYLTISADHISALLSTPDR